MPFFVSRQGYWGADPDECWVVEIAGGGRDYANPDMLCAKYAGEGEEYEDPREAVEAALAIAESWRNDAPDKVISVAYGHTMGFTMPFEPTKQKKKKLRQWAEETYNKLPRCDQCGGLLPERHLEYEEGFKFCREYCAEKWQAAQGE